MPRGKDNALSFSRQSHLIQVLEGGEKCQGTRKIRDDPHGHHYLRKVLLRQGLQLRIYPRERI